MSFIDNPSSATDVVYSVPKPSMCRALTLVSELPEPPSAEPAIPGGLVPDDFHVPCLDLSLDPNGVNTPGALISNLEKASIAHLLDIRLKAALAHVNKLKVRIADTRSKVHNNIII